ncbi:hypothetical protein K4K57_002097 [Colletotrichum sp. SAR 10_99]|nr:hypothetical protein K4K55_004567 [Colletotrichum sp. SAR 10_96]KAJ5019137.1 hypothetical protein K4K57_002097 [Colletotrichum sp. SAR 10_99]
MAVSSALRPEFYSHSPRPIPSIMNLGLRPPIQSHPRPVPAPEKPPQSITGEDWETLSPLAKIQWLGDDKWGWVAYRCSYANEFDGAWEDLKRRIPWGMRDSIARSDAPGIFATMEFLFIEEAALENAPIEELQRRFQAWAREGNAAGVNADYVLQGSRYGVFLRLDSEALCNGYVGLVRAWPEPPGSEDWTKIRASAFGPGLYVELDNPEVC